MPSAPALIRATPPRSSPHHNNSNPSQTFQRASERHHLLPRLRRPLLLPSARGPPMDCGRLRSSGFIPPPIAPRIRSSHHPPANLHRATVCSVLPLPSHHLFCSSSACPLPDRCCCFSLSSPSPLLKRPRRRSGPSNRVGVSRACGPDAGNTPSKVFVEEAIGAEYGEGFETFRMDGPLKMDVDFLNDKLQECFLQRIRHAMKPDEAFGLIFSWDNVVADTRSMKLDAWRQLAVEERRDLPNDIHVQRRMLYTTADHVLQKVLSWGSEKSDLQRLKSRLLQLYHEKFLDLNHPVHGLREWLDALYTSGIPCAVVSSLDRKNMLGALERMGLRKYFQAFVSEEDGMESIAHRFLSAAVKLNRKPAKCIVFEDDPRGITAAHNCTMMAVALIGAHPAYELVQADLAVSSFSELSVINLRRLFANKGSNFMDLQKQIIDKAPQRRKLTIASDSLSP